jgi:U3 small nucleolar RNA-associated protein 18
MKGVSKARHCRCHLIASSLQRGQVWVLPLKAFMHLTTSLDNLRFNFDSQILALSSRTKKDALRLVHVPSNTVFSNWPTPKTPLQYVHSMAFSPGGGYFAAGKADGRVLLYRLHHYDHA